MPRTRHGNKYVVKPVKVTKDYSFRDEIVSLVVEVCIYYNVLWILSQKIVELIFGPNLHVEVIKQCHVLLNFLAVEGKITNEHINVIWQAAQLKHCSKQVHDLLLPLIKNLEAGPVLHLYDLMKELPVKGMHFFRNLDLQSYVLVIASHRRRRR